MLIISFKLYYYVENEMKERKKKKEKKMYVPRSLWETMPPIYHLDVGNRSKNTRHQ